jgi:hypothetical protein
VVRQAVFIVTVTGIVIEYFNLERIPEDDPNKGGNMLE